MKAIVTGTAIAVVLATTLAFAANRPGSAEGRLADCLTSADVVRHAERSRNGVSLSCDEETRLRNRRREASR